MPKRTRDYEAGLHERLRDPVYAVEYLKASLEGEANEDTYAAFLLSLRDVVRAHQDPLNFP